jgi:flagellar hook-length control protein FliK
MNVNLTTIAALSVSSTQSACGHSANKTGGSDDAAAASARDSDVTPNTAVNPSGDTDNGVNEKASTTSPTKESQASKSDDTQIEVSDKAGGKTNSDFKKVLKKHLKQDEAETDQNAGQNTAQSQTAVANDVSQTAQPGGLPVIQVEVMIPAQQSADVSASIQPTQIIPKTNRPVLQINKTDPQTSQSPSQTDQTATQTSQTVSQIPAQAVSVSLPQTQTVDNGVQVALQNTQGQVVQSDALQQTQTPVSDETQAQIQNSTNTAQATEPTTRQMSQIFVVNQGHQQQQGREQTQPVSVQMPSTNTVNNQDVAETTRKNTDNDTVKSDSDDVPAKSLQIDSGTPVETSNQDKSNFNVNVVSTDSTNQMVSEQPKAQPVDSTSAATNQNSNTSYVPIITTTAGQQAGKETTTHNNAQNESGSNQQDTTLLTTDSRTTLSTVNGLAGEGNKAGIETVSLQDTVSQPQSKSQADSLSVQSLGLQAMTATTPGHVTDAQPVIASHSAATTNNTSAQDTTASLREQICMSVQNSVQQGQHQITINLNPPELGRVSIKFTEQSGQLTGSLEATNSQTRADIQQAIPEMLRSLEQSGINIKRIDVSLSDISGQSSHNFSRESASQNQWEQLAQQGFDNTGGGRFSQDSYVASSRFSGTSEFGGDTRFDWNQSSSSENLLNVLI